MLCPISQEKSSFKSSSAFKHNLQCGSSNRHGVPTSICKAIWGKPVFCSSHQLPKSSWVFLHFDTQMHESAAALRYARLQGRFWTRKCLILSVPAWLNNWMQHLAPVPFGSHPVEGASLFPVRTVGCFLLANHHVIAIASNVVSLKNKTKNLI